MEEKKVKSNPKALFPIALFLVLYLGNGVFFEYIKPQEGQMGFYVVSVVLAFSIALIAAFLQNRKLSFDEKIHICAKGIGDDNIVIMLFIFLMAGGFSGIASQAGHRVQLICFSMLYLESMLFRDCFLYHALYPWPWEQVLVPYRFLHLLPVQYRGMADFRWNCVWE